MLPSQQRGCMIPVPIVYDLTSLFQFEILEAGDNCGGENPLGRWPVWHRGGSCDFSLALTMLSSENVKNVDVVIEVALTAHGQIPEWLFSAIKTRQNYKKLSLQRTASKHWTSVY